MRMTAVKTSETSVSALAKRLYSDLSESALKKVETALLKANPHLVEAAAFKPGATVILPTVPGVKPKPGARGDDPVDDLLDHLQEATDDYKTFFAARLEAASADLASQEAIVKDREVAAAIKASPEATEMAKSLAANLRERKKKLAAAKQEHEELFALISRDLSALFK